MSENARTLCIACGLEVQSPPVFPTRPDGKPCAVCRERLFESLPPLLPSRPPRVRTLDENGERALYRGLDAEAFLEEPRSDPSA